VEKTLEIALDARNVIELDDYTTFLIHSQNGGGWSMVTGAGCECKDYQYNGGPCKHMIARWLVIRAQQADGTRRVTEPAVEEWSRHHEPECSCVLRARAAQCAKRQHEKFTGRCCNERDILRSAG
jgi:hypothetical protein